MNELSKSKMNQYSSLGSVKMRRRLGLFTVEGEKAVEDSLPSFRLEALICEEGYKPRFVVEPDKLFYVSADRMHKLSNLSTHSRVMAVFKLPDTDTDNVSGLPDALYAVLDGIQDPGNLGTIIRTCHWFGIKRIFASYDTVDMYNPKTLQSAMGSIGKVSVTYCSLPDLFSENRGLPVYGTLLEGEDIFRTRLSKRGFIVMGNEGKGLSEEVKDCVSKALYIPPANSNDHSESLNVAVAFAIVMAMFSR